AVPWGGRWRRVVDGRYFSGRRRPHDAAIERDDAVLPPVTGRCRSSTRALRELWGAAAGRALLRLRPAGEGTGQAFFQPGRGSPRQRVALGRPAAAYAVPAEHAARLPGRRIPGGPPGALRQSGTAVLLPGDHHLLHRTADAQFRRQWWREHRRQQRGRDRA